MSSLMLQSLFGFFSFIGLAFLISENRRQFPYRVVAVGVVLQFILGAIFLYLPSFRQIVLYLNKFVQMLDEATSAGTSFVFGYLGGGPSPFEIANPSYSFVLAFKALPLLLVVSALSSVLFHWRILPMLVNGFAYALKKTMRIGGAEGVGLSASIFMGMVESPMLIRPYLLNMTRSEVFSIMVCGMATVAGTVMVLYANILGTMLPNAMGHLVIASIISIPASIIVAKVMVPETQKVELGRVKIKIETRSTMDALTSGATNGVSLVINIVSILIVLVASIHFINLILDWIPPYAGRPITLQRLLGVLMAPLVWLMGIPWHEAFTAGSLMGIKTVLNELIAYVELAKIGNSLSDRSQLILVYALCGFANIGSLGILIGGLCTIAPQRKTEFIELGFRSVVAGTLATCMTGAVIGVLIAD